MVKIMSVREKYRTILLDPPWRQKAGRPLSKYTLQDGNQIWHSDETISRDLSFPSMSVGEIKEVPVKRLAETDAHLYMWVTNKYMPDFADIIKGWGFKYSTTHTWAKNMMGGGLGGAYKINSEFLIYATRGSLKAKATFPGTWHNVKRDYKNGFPQHSKKPEYFRKMIESVSPGPYLELFARQQVAEWDCIGFDLGTDVKQLFPDSI